MSPASNETLHSRLFILEELLRKAQGVRKDLLQAVEEAETAAGREVWLGEIDGLDALIADYVVEIESLRRELTAN